MSEAAIKGAITLGILVVALIAGAVRAVKAIKVAKKNEGNWYESDVKALLITGTLLLYFVVVSIGSIIIKFIGAMH